MTFVARTATPGSVERGDVLRLVLGRALRIVGAGLVVGLAVARRASRIDPWAAC